MLYNFSSSDSEQINPIGDLISRNSSAVINNTRTSKPVDVTQKKRATRPDRRRVLTENLINIARQYKHFDPNITQVHFR